MSTTTPNATSSYIKSLAPKMPTKYLRDFFAEKDIPEVIFDVEGPGGSNSIPNGVVVEHITTCGADEAEQIADVLRKIDFHNGDTNDFLRHLAGAIAR